MAQVEGSSEVPARGSICGPKLSARYILAVLGSVGMGIVYGLKVNLHVAIVSMVNHKALAADHNQIDTAHASEMCHFDEGADPSSTIASEDGPFEWSTSIQGTLLSAYFWGYLVSQLPGGRIAEMLSAKSVMLFAVAINVICALLTPLLTPLHYGALLVIRVAQGIGGGVTFPGMHVLLAHWAPPNERSTMSSIVYAGTALGTVIFTLASGVIAGACGWKAIFYIEGGLSAIWLVLWWWLIADDPTKQPYISIEERELITSSLQRPSSTTKHRPKLSLRAVFTSPAFLAILVAHTCSNWGWYMVLIELPSYMRTVLNFKISSNAILSSIPFLCMWLFSMCLSKVLDTLLARKRITTTTARKCATLIASLVPLICFVALCYIGCERTAAVILMTTAVTAIGGMFCGFLSNHIDIAPNFAGTLVAITNSVATIPGIVVPIFVGYLTHSDTSIRSWRIVFWTTIALYVVEIVVYTVWGSGEVQSWNDPDEGGNRTDTRRPEEHPLKMSSLEDNSTATK